MSEHYKVENYELSVFTLLITVINYALCLSFVLLLSSFRLFIFSHLLFRKMHSALLHCMRNTDNGFKDYPCQEPHLQFNFH